MTDTMPFGDYTASGAPSNIELGPDWERPDRAALEQLANYSTANVGDALGRLGMPDGGITALWDGCRAVGSALTVLAVAGDDLAVIEAVRQVQAGDFIVVNGFGYLGRAVMGDILAHMFRSRGAVGAIVDGAIRDRDEIRRLGFPIWSRAVVPAGPWKNGPGAIGTPVAIGGVVIHPGDLVVADADGIAAIPRYKTQNVITELARIRESETRMRNHAGDVAATSTH